MKMNPMTGETSMFKNLTVERKLGWVLDRSESVGDYGRCGLYRSQPNGPRRDEDVRH